jgi:hypothetical protein
VKPRSLYRLLIGSSRSLSCLRPTESGLKQSSSTFGSLYPPVREGQGELGPYQVRPIQKYFLEQLRKRMEATEVSQGTVLFVPLVDPKLCPTRDDFQMDKKDKYKYYVIGGNHSACDRMDLSRTNPILIPFVGYKLGLLLV